MVDPLSVKADARFTRSLTTKPLGGMGCLAASQFEVRTAAGELLPKKRVIELPRATTTEGN